MNVYRVSETWQQLLVFDVRRKAFVEGQNIPLELEYDEIYGEKYNYILLEKRMKVIGTSRINLSNKDYAKIERVAITPEFQRKGLGSRLIFESEEWIKEFGINTSVITSQVQAAAFYEKLGYKINKEVELHSSIPTVYMEKELV